MTATALAPRARTSLVRNHGGSLATLAFGVGFAVAIASVAAAVVALACCVGLFCVERPSVRERRELRARRRERVRRVEAADVASDELVELMGVVDATLRADPSMDGNDLEGLLDRYADLAIARDRCAELVRRDRIAELSRRLEHAVRAQQPRRKRAVARRIAWWHRCEARLRRLDEQVTDVAGLIRLYGERATTPDLAFVLDGDPVGALLDQLEACE